MKRDLSKEFQGGLMEINKKNVGAGVIISSLEGRGFKTVMTSLEISDLTGKLHKNIIADIRDETEKLGERIGQLIFQPSSYINSQNKEQPMYNLSKDGVHQLGARYDAKIRFSIIQRMNQLESKPMTIEDMIISQAESVKAIREDVRVLEDKIDNRMGLSGAQAAQIGKLVSKKVFERANDISKYEIGYIGNEKINVSMLYSDINKNLKAYYGVSIRSDIPQSKYEEVCEMIENWKESYETRSKFIKINKQKEI